MSVVVIESSAAHQGAAALIVADHDRPLTTITEIREIVV